MRRTLKATSALGASLVFVNAITASDLQMGRTCPRAGEKAKSCKKHATGRLQICG